MRGKMTQALGGLKELYDGGADPAAVLIELAEFVHLVTRLKLAPAAVEDSAITQEERERGAAFAASLSTPVLTRAWQLLSKGLQEVKDSDRPLAAADMVLVRLAHAADLPTPDEALRKLASLTNDFSAPAAGARETPRPAGAAPSAVAVASGSASRPRDMAINPAQPSGAATALAPAARRSRAGDASFDIRRGRGSGCASPRHPVETRT